MCMCSRAGVSVRCTTFQDNGRFHCWALCLLRLLGMPRDIRSQVFPPSLPLFAAPELPGSEVWPQCDRRHEGSRPQGGTHGCILLPLSWEKAELSQNPQSIVGKAVPTPSPHPQPPRGVGGVAGEGRGGAVISPVVCLTLSPAVLLSS